MLMLDSFTQFWKSAFSENESSQAILERARNLERASAIWCSATTGMFWLIAIMSMGQGGSSGITSGCLIVLIGLILAGILGITAEIRLTIYWRMWEARRREEAELRQSIAEDL